MTQAVSRDVAGMGPVSYLVVEFHGNKMSGEGLPTLIDLVDVDVIKLLDLMRQANRWAQQGDPMYGAPSEEQEYAPQPPQPAPDPITQLKELAELKNQDVLTDEEFQAQKRKILNA